MSSTLGLANVRVMTTLLFQAAGHAGYLVGGPALSGRAARHYCRLAHLEPDAGPAPARALPRHRRGADSGRTLEGRAPRALLPARVVMAVFRGKMLGALRWAFARDAVGCQRPCVPSSFSIFNRLGHAQKTPGMHIRERYRHGAGGHVSRAVPAGGPIKNARLVAYDGDCVTFTYRTRQGEADAGPMPLPNG